MNFNTGAFLLFMPLVVVIHWLLPHRMRAGWLLFASWFFYAYFAPAAFLLLLAETRFTFLCARQMTRKPERKRNWMLTAVIGTLAVLFFFKYRGLFQNGGNGSLSFLLPAGISFYTFQAMGYVVDVYRGDVPAEESFLSYALFISFFPQLVAGPIERSDHLLPQLKARHSISEGDLRAGLLLLLSGYFKKVVIADGLSLLVDPVYASPRSGNVLTVTMATLFFAGQIYMDFSGYSDIARGTARLFGISLMQNFDRPYQASSIREYWQRWHISLNRWFTAYVYIPLGGNRKGKLRKAGNILTVFLLSGLWHGAGAHFLVWGMIHGILYLFEEKLPEKRKQGLTARIRTIFLVIFAWLFFRATSLKDAGLMLQALTVLPSSWEGAFVIRGMILLLAAWQMDRHPDLKNLRGDKGVLAVTLLAMATILSWLVQLAAGGQNAFIYFQF